MLNLFKKLNPLVFIVSFMIGMVYCYYKKPTKRIVYRHPTLENMNKLIYHDNNNECYKYSMDNIDCPENKELISSIPPQLE